MHTEKDGTTSEKELKLAAKVEPFDSYWQAPKDVEGGYDKFRQYYKSNFLTHLPKDRDVSILVISCGPGYFVNLLTGEGYRNVLGIDSDPVKIEYAKKRDLACRVEEAFPFLSRNEEQYDVIVCEQELNHLTKEEGIEFLGLVRQRLKPGGTLCSYGLNGANPILGAEILAQNFDHFYTFTEYSYRQLLELTGFDDIRVIPLKLYVFYKNPLNYVGMFVTGFLNIVFRVFFKLYGKTNRIFSKKIAAVCKRPID